MLRSKRIVLVLLVATFLFGAGVEASVAASGGDWCEEACNEDCDSCDTAQVVGCTCSWLCEDGSRGSQICTL